MGQRSLKKQEKPLIIFLRLYGEAKERMETLCKTFSTDHNSIGMAGTLAEMHRLERLPGTITHEEVVTVTEVKALGGHPVDILKAAIPGLMKK